MCFSAEASFGLGAVLIPAGAYCSAIAFRKDHALLPLALVPFGFGLQQCCEGFVWLGLNSANSTVVHLSSMLFLFFALAFWPIWIPLSVRCMEPRIWARRYLGFVTLLGVAIGGILFLPLVASPQVLSTTQVHHSVQYSMVGTPAMDHFPWALVQIAYISVIAVPLFVSSIRGFATFGIIVIGSAAISYGFYCYAFASVWCFFAAVISTYLCYVIQKGPVTYP